MVYFSIHVSVALKMLFSSSLAFIALFFCLIHSFSLKFFFSPLSSCFLGAPLILLIKIMFFSLSPLSFFWGFALSLKGGGGEMSHQEHGFSSQLFSFSIFSLSILVSLFLSNWCFSPFSLSECVLVCLWRGGPKALLKCPSLSFTVFLDCLNTILTALFCFSFHSHN